MTIGRTTAVINKVEDARAAHGQIRSTDALQRVFPTTVARYLTFHGSVRQDATGTGKNA